MRNFSKFLFLFLFISFSSFAKDCSELKKSILSDNSYQDSDIKELQKGVEANNECMKNLMGIMLYNGFYFPQDKIRGEKIFYDLSNSNYPEAQFNFALAMTKRTDQDPNNVITLISGIYYKYAEDRNVSHLSSLSRDLGRKYIESLKSLVNLCNENKKIFGECNSNLRSLSESNINQISSTYENTIRDAQTIVANKRLALSAETKDQADTFVAILSIGMMVHSLSSMPNGVGGASAPNIPSGPNPWFNYGQGFGNPLNLYQFHL